MSYDVLKEIYHGNYRVTERTFKRDSEYGRVMDKIVTLSDRLQTGLSAEQKDTLNQLDAAYHDLTDLTALEDFVTGFRLGMRLTLEGVADGDGAFTMISMPQGDGDVP